MSRNGEMMELVQVAAVAVASLENTLVHPTGAILGHVAMERERQDEKWGEQKHSRIEWAMILTEEIGEWAEEVRKFHGGETLRAEYRMADEVLETLVRAGDGARFWLDHHEWPERQQQVYNRETS
jgi:hypothetical protein